MSDFPPELWLRILDCALLVPGALSTEYDNPFQACPAFWNTPMQSEVPNRIVGAAVVRSNAFALNLMLVCRTWHDIAITKLYRHLRIRSNHHLHQLVRTLAASYSNASVGNDVRPLGFVVRRLDLAIEDLPWPGEGWEESQHLIEELFNFLPNIQILELCSQWESRPTTRTLGGPVVQFVSIPLKAWEKIAATCGQSLRRIEHISGKPQNLRLDVMNARDLFRLFPNMRTLGPGMELWRTGSCWFCDAIAQGLPLPLQSCPLFFPAQIPLPCECGNISRPPLSTPPCPDLNTVFLYVRSLVAEAGSDPRPAKRFIQSQGPRLEIIYLLGTAFGMPALSEALQVLGQHCQNLSGLVFFSHDLFSGSVLHNPDFQHQRRLDLIKNIPKTVTRIAVKANDPSATSAAWVGFRRVICWFAVPEIKSTSIKVLRIFRVRENEDIWTGTSSGGRDESGETWDALEGSDEALHEDSPEELFERRSSIRRERFAGALRRLSSWGIQVDYPNGRLVNETD